MNKRILVLVTSLVLLAALVASCAPTTPTPTGTATPTPTPTATTPAQVYKIRITDPSAAIQSNPMYIGANTLKTECEKAFGGRVKVEYYPSASLYKTLPGNQAALAGAVEVAYSTETYMGNVLGDKANPLSTNQLPTMSPNKACYKEQMDTLMPIWNKDIYEPNAGHVVAYFPTWGIHFFLRKPANNPDELKGRLCRAAGLLSEDELKAAGVKPITIDSAEVVTAAQTGTIDGAITATTFGYRNQWYVYMPYVTLPTVPGGTSSGIWLGNYNWYKGLPADIRDKLDKDIFPKVNADMYANASEIMDNWEKLYTDGKANILRWSQADQDKWDALMKPVLDKWIPIVGEKYYKIALDIKAKYVKK